MVRSDRTELPEEWPVYSSAAAARVEGMVRAGAVFDYAGQGAVLELERAVAARHDGRFTVSFNSGTSALFAAYAALGIASGDEVLVPNLTFLATASPLLWLGATPVLCESSPDHPNVDASTLAARITPRTRAIAVTHLFGDPVDMGPIAALARDANLALVEDCSHAHASTVDGGPVGMAGDAAIYSLGARKMVSGGHGGVLVTPHRSVHDTALLIGHFKPRTRSAFAKGPLAAHAEIGLGGNLRMSPLAAVLALDHFHRLEELGAAKLRHVEVLDAALAGRLVPVRARSPSRNNTFYDLVYQLPEGVDADRRDALVTAMNAAGVPAGAPSTRPLDVVLQAVADAGTGPRSGLLDGLAAWAAAVSDRPPLQVSQGHHDRSISLPATRLWTSEPEIAHVLAARFDDIDWPAPTSRP